MNEAKRLIFNAFVAFSKAYQSLFMRVYVRGREHIPPGPNIYVTNHIASTDPYWVIPVFTEPVHVIVGPGYRSALLAPLLNYLEQINALPEHRKTAVDRAVAFIHRGESVYTAPEGDIQDPDRLGHFFPGAARIYRRTRAPIIPIALLAPRRAMSRWPRFDINVDGRTYRCVMVLRGPYFINVGRPLRPAIRDDLDEVRDSERITDQIKSTIAALVAEVRRSMEGVE